MSEASQYNSLGQILSRGAEITLARALSRGETYETVRGRIVKRFGAIAPEDEISFASMGQRMVDAGIAIGELSPTMPIPAELIPLNKWLFGDDPAGRRVLAGVKVTDPFTDESREIIEEYPDILTFEEMVHLAQLELSRRMAKSPGEFEEFDDDRLTQILINIIYIERRF